MRYIDVIFTKVKLTDTTYKNRYRFLCDYPCKVGDMLDDNGFHGTPVQVLDIGETDSPYVDGVKLREYFPSTINGNPAKPIYNNDMNSVNSTENSSMFSGMMDSYKNQYMPQKEDSVRMSIEGTLAIPVDGMYYSIYYNKATNKYSRRKYTKGATIELPVYSIERPTASVVVGDIIKSGKNSFAYVTGKDNDGNLKTLSYTGYGHTQVAAEDFLLQQATTRVLINMFNFNGNGFNPIIFALGNGDNVNMKDLMILSMTPQGKNLFSNTGGGFNPMLFMLLDKDKQGAGGNDMLEMMMMSSMFNNGNAQNPLTSMFGQPTVKVDDEPIKEQASKTDEKIDKMTEALTALTQLIANNMSNNKTKNA